MAVSSARRNGRVSGLAAMLLGLGAVGAAAGNLAGMAMPRGVAPDQPRSFGRRAARGKPGAPGDRHRRGKVGNHVYCKAAWTGSPASRAPGGKDALRARPPWYETHGDQEHLRRCHARMKYGRGTPGANKRRNLAEREACARAVWNAHAHTRLAPKGDQWNWCQRRGLRRLRWRV